MGHWVRTFVANPLIMQVLDTLQMCAGGNVHAQTHLTGNIGH